MDFLIIFLEGVISFISPCMLPMLPIYISYFAGDADKKHKVLARSLAFVLGFTVVFGLLGLVAGGAGSLLSEYRVYLNAVCGIIVIFFGLGYLDIIHLNFFKGMNNAKRVTSLAGALVFGMIYSVSLTPCVGAFLGSALSLERVGPFGAGAGESMDHCEGGEGMGGRFPFVCRDDGGFLPISGFARNME